MWRIYIYGQVEAVFIGNAKDSLHYVCNSGYRVLGYQQDAMVIVLGD